MTKFYVSSFHHPSKEHLAFTKHLHLTQFSAVVIAPFHVKSFSLSFCRTVRLHVFFGLPQFLGPWKFQSSAILLILSGFFLSV